ncbi:MAG: helicase-associated domain-containing protein [Corynebacteriales bacterium]|nr:helicase-associated domain-containing protein [Mycobacteriales bacterium]
MSTSTPQSANEPSAKLAEKTRGHDLAQHLRALDDEKLLSLLRIRPDLAIPLPGDFPALASRAASPSSLTRTIHQLTRFELEILAVARTTHRKTELTSKTGADAESALEALSERALAWEFENMIHVTAGLAEVLGPPESPPQFHPKPPTVQAKIHTNVESTGAAAALDVLRSVEGVLNFCADNGPANLRSGGIALKDQRQLAQTLQQSETHTALLLDISHSSGLLETTAERPGEWLPTAQFDVWNASPAPIQWRTLANAWLNAPRLPHLAGTRDENDRRIAALSPEITRRAAPALRRQVLEILAQRPAGESLTPTEVIEQLDWRYARAASPSRAHAIEAILREAESLGITGRGALTEYGRLLYHDEPEAAARELDKVLPPPIDYILVQADLTIIAPGPLTSDLASDMTLVADQESSGGALVFRVSAESLARGLRSGKTAAELHKLFAQRSRTPIPQNLTYLIDDVARRHGGLRLGAVGSYLRSEDTTLLASLIADRTLSPLQLRLLAPTVAVSPLAAHRISALITDAGYPLALEDTTGSLVVAPKEERRTGARQHWQPSAPTVLDEKSIRAALPLLRRADAAVHAKPESAPRPQSMEEILSLLTHAAGDKQMVDIGYLDPHGEVRSRTVRAISVGGGFLRAEDPRAESAHTFQLHRLTFARAHAG